MALLGPRELGTGGAFGPGSIVIHVISYLHVNARNGAVVGVEVEGTALFNSTFFGK